MTAEEELARMGRRSDGRGREKTAGVRREIERERETRTTGGENLNPFLSARVSNGRDQWGQTRTNRAPGVRWGGDCREGGLKLCF